MAYSIFTKNHLFI